MAKKNKSNYKKLLIFSGVGIIFLLIISYFLMGKILENLVNKEIRAQINEYPGQLYQIKTGHVSLDILNGAIMLTDIILEPTDSAFTLIDNNVIQSLIKLKFDEFNIDGLKIISLIRSGHIDIRQLNAGNIKLELITNNRIKRQQNNESFQFEDLFTENFTSAEIGHLNVSNFSLFIFNLDDIEHPSFTIDSLNLTFENVLVNKETFSNPVPVYFENMRINTGNLILNTSAFYTLSTNNIVFKLQDSTLLIDELRLLPRLSKKAFDRKVKYNSDRFYITIPGIRFNDFNLTELANDFLIHCNSIEIDEPLIEIDRDKNLPDAPYKYKPLLESMISDIPVDFRIDTLHIHNGKLTYEELAKGATDPGRIYFDPFSITMYNITNQADAIKQSPTLTIDFNGEMMGSAKVNATIRADLAAGTDYFEVTGSMEPVSATIFNPMLVPLTSMRIESFDLQHCNFSFFGNDNRSSGNIHLHYDNFKIRVLNDDPEKNNSAISFLANNLIRTRNLPTERKLLVGQIDFERRKDKSMINYIWNSLKTGIISIISPVANKSTKAIKQQRASKKKS